LRDKFNKYAFWKNGISPSEYDKCCVDDIDLILLIDNSMNEESEVKRKQEELKQKSQNAVRRK